MAKQSTQMVVGELKKLISEKGEQLGNEIEGEIQKLITELQSSSKHSHFDELAEKRIYSGFNFFKTSQFDKHSEFFEKLAKEQNPKFLVFACSDSRVSPSHILGFQLGEAFMASNIGNMVPAFDKIKHSGVGAIIEYAVGTLNVQNILVIGHSRCGGIHRLMTHPEDGSKQLDFVDNWVKIGLPAKEFVKENYEHLSSEEQLTICEKESVKNSVKNLWTYPYVKKAAMNGALKVWGGYYDFVNGGFELLDVAHIGPQPAHPPHSHPK